MVSLWDESHCIRPLFSRFPVDCLLVSFRFVSAPFLCLVCVWHSLSVVFTQWVQCWNFSWVLALPSSLVGLVPLFFCSRWFSLFRRSFRLLRLFSFFLDLPRVLSLLIPRDPPLGSCSLLRLLPGVSFFGFSLASFAVLQSSRLFFGGFPPLPVFVSPFSPVAGSPLVACHCFWPLSLRPLQAVVAVSSLLGSSFSCLLFWHSRCPGLSLSLSLLLSRCPFLEAICGFPPVDFLLCSVRTLLFLPSWMDALFLSPRAPFRPLSRPALLFFVRGFFVNNYSSSSASLLSLVSSSSASLASSSFVLVPQFVFLGFGVSLLLGLSPVALLCLLFWRPLSGLLPLSCLLYVCSLFPSLLLASFRLGSFAGCG